MFLYFIFRYSVGSNFVNEGKYIVNTFIGVKCFFKEGFGMVLRNLEILGFFEIFLI